MRLLCMYGASKEAPDQKLQVDVCGFSSKLSESHKQSMAAWKLNDMLEIPYNCNKIMPKKVRYIDSCSP